MERRGCSGSMCSMKPALKKLLYLRPWPVVYALFAIVALSSARDAMADDESDFRLDVLPDTEAEIEMQARHWAFTKSLRLELAKSEHLQLETTIPLDHVEGSRITLGIAKKVSRNWSFRLNVWAVL